MFFTSFLVESIKYLELYLNKIFKKKIDFIRNNHNSRSNLATANINNENDEDIIINEQSPLVRSLRIPASIDVVKRQR